MFSLLSLAPFSHGHPFGEPCNLTDFPYIHLSWDPFAGDVGLYKAAPKAELPTFSTATLRHLVASGRGLHVDRRKKHLQGVPRRLARGSPELRTEILLRAERRVELVGFSQSSVALGARERLKRPPPPASPLRRYHPVGFAYEVGGAHNTCACPADAPDCPNIAVEGECPELGGEGVDGTMSTIQYITKTVAETKDESGFGLDAYEPFFFYPFGDWYEGCGGADAPCHVEFEAPVTQRAHSRELNTRRHV